MRIGWILSGTRKVAGARLQGYLMHETLSRMGVDSRLLYAPSSYTEQLEAREVRELMSVLKGLDVLLFQKVYGDEALRLAKYCRDEGIATIYIACNLQGHDMVETADHTIAVSARLKAAFGYRNRNRITVIEDPVDVTGHPGKTDYSNNGPLRLVYVAGEPMTDPLLGLFHDLGDDFRLCQITAPPKPARVNVTGPPARKRRLCLGTLRAHPVDTYRKIRNRMIVMREKRMWSSVQSRSDPVPYDWIEWKEDTVCDEIVRCDVGVIPCELVSEWSLCKSANRATMLMALGMPVVASPLPAYCEMIDDGNTGYIAHSIQDWRRALDALRNRKVRRHIGEAARRYACKRHGPEATACRYLDCVKGVNMRRRI